MAFTTSYGYTDSITTAKNVAIVDLDYAKDFAVTKDTADEVVITNTTSPVDQPETIRFGYQTVGNVYANTGIDPSMMAITKQGISLVAQVNDILRVTNNDENCCSPIVYDLPIQAHVVIKVPKNQFVTADVALTAAKRAFSALFATGQVTSARLNAMLRDALKPSEM